MESEWPNSLSSMWEGLQAIFAASYSIRLCLFPEPIFFFFSAFSIFSLYREVHDHEPAIHSEQITSLRSALANNISDNPVHNM